MHFLKYFLLSSQLFLFTVSLCAQSVKSLDRKRFYEAMRLDKKDLVTAELKVLDKAPQAIKDPFGGAMLMKKAGLGANPAKKLSEFKKGHSALEAAIKANPNNAEYRFLRLMIQEHAPGILGYKDDMESDSEYIKKSYKTLPAEVQQAIADYSKKSKVLKLAVS